jgi:hypothetical protein
MKVKIGGAVLFLGRIRKDGFHQARGSDKVFGFSESGKGGPGSRNRRRTLPTKVSADNLGWTGNLQKIGYKSWISMALGS